MVVHGVEVAMVVRGVEVAMVVHGVEVTGLALVLVVAVVLEMQEGHL